MTSHQQHFDVIGSRWTSESEMSGLWCIRCQALREWIILFSISGCLSWKCCGWWILQNRPFSSRYLAGDFRTWRERCCRRRWSAEMRNKICKSGAAPGTASSRPIWRICWMLNLWKSEKIEDFFWWFFIWIKVDHCFFFGVRFQIKLPDDPAKTDPVIFAWICLNYDVIFQRYEVTMISRLIQLWRHLT